MSTYPAIPNPDGSIPTQEAAILALKEAVEVLIRQRGLVLDSAVTWRDLVAIGVVTTAQVPKK